MSRVLPIWLLAPALVAFVGCGGGAAPDSGAVASNSNDAAPAAGGAAMPTENSSMETPGADMTSTAGGAEMSADMYGSTAGGASDPATATEMSPEMYAAGGGEYPGGAADPASDAAAMASAYGAEGAYPGGDPAAASEASAYPGAGVPGAEGAYPGADPAAVGEAGAYPGAGVPGAEGAYPGGANPAGAAGAEAYAGGEYPGGPGGGAVEEKVPEGFDGKAQLAFRRGKEKDAMQYLYAYALTTDAGAESLLPTLRWVEALQQPTLAVRWGAGFVVTAPRNFGGDPKPVGSQQTLPTRGGSRAGGNEGGAGAGGEAGYGAGGGSGGGGDNSLLAKGAGELGEKLVAAYSERVMGGDFGEVLKKAMEGSNAGNRGNAGGGAAAGYGGEGYADPGGAASGYGAKAGAESAGPGGAPAAATQVTQIVPGLSMLGIGTQKELIERAREDGIDAVVILDVKLRVAAGLVTNETTLALLDAKTQKKLHTTRKLNNITIQKARAEGKEDDVDKELEGLFEAIDANFKMTKMNVDRAAKRIAALTEETPDNPLPILAEARLYHDKGLLEESALFAAYEKLLDVDSGRLLATGTEEDKKKALGRWLPES